MPGIDKHILIVENQAIIALDLKFICEEISNVCSHISYSNEAVKNVKEINPDLVLMDIEVIDDTEIINEAEKICDEFEIPIVFFTRTHPDSLKNHRLQNRCVFQSIPFTKDDIISSIKKLLNTYDYKKREK
jgi:two-component SAPR family response regulator